MRRTNHHLIRLGFILVIGMALFGGWFADRNWQVMSMDFPVPVDHNTDWVGLVSVFLEDALQFFQGATSVSG
jgi:hypothetical protein